MTMSSSQRVLAAIGSLAGACAIAVPAAIALSHNPSFGQRIPVHAPLSAHIVSFDDHGGVLEITHSHKRHHGNDHHGNDHRGNEDHGGDHRHGGRDDGR